MALRLNLAKRGIRYFTSSPGINTLYVPESTMRLDAFQKPAHLIAKKPSTANDHPLDYSALLKKHADREWTPEEIDTSIRRNTMFSWGATDSIEPIQVARGEGVYFYDTRGKKYIDFNSQAMCANLGHSNQEIIEAVYKQMKEIPYSYACVTVTPIKAKLSALLADILPGDLNTFFFTSGGAESNEAAIRFARRMTGKHKIIARYRSYHGGSLGAMALTGDPRRWGSEPGATGVVHVFDPYPYTFQWGQSEEEISRNNLIYLKETIEYEGPNNVAAIFLESVTGTNGVLKPPKGYLEGIRQLCDEYGILMIVDEVMAGFGRTGKWFGFMHSDPVVIPDIVTLAKGINGAYLPLGAVAVREHVAEFFKKSPTAYGSTYNSHPTALASSFAAIRYMLKNKVIENAASNEAVVREEMIKLKNKHKCIKQGRVVGLFGVLDLQRNEKGDPLTEYGGANHPAMAEFKKAMHRNGLFAHFRWHNLLIIPPLIITPTELREGFAILDKALDVIDKSI